MPLSSKTWGLGMTAATAGIAVIGTWYGAGLKESKEIQQKAQTRKEATPAERLALLSETLRELKAKKAALENKLAQIKARNRDGDKNVLENR